jgi:hypothetical protein
MGPVAVFAALLLLFASPLMRGGNRQVALIVLEAIALIFLLSLWIGAVFSRREQTLKLLPLSHRTLLVVFLVLSPAWLALVYLLPVPAELWSAASSREIYLQLLRDIGLTPNTALPLSLAPDATRVSLLAGLPLIAGFLAGYAGRLPQLRLLLGLVVAIAFFQILLGLLQIAGGSQSTLYFGGVGGRPFGTFANANHFANYLAMALVAYLWLSWDGMLRRRSRALDSHAPRFVSRHAIALWAAGGLILVLGILISRSRGAVLAGLPAGTVAALVVAVSVRNRSHGGRFTLMLIGGVLAGALALVGLDNALDRFQLSGMVRSSLYRGLLASTTLDGAAAFWPWGAGWGTYVAVYPRFRPMGFDGIADYAHNDYAQLLFDGGIFAVLLAAAFLWLAGNRAVLLTRSALLHRLNRDQMACALCGLGLLGLLLHSLVDFNMHIPANAILGAMLAGIYLRPLDDKDVQT